MEHNEINKRIDWNDWKDGSLSVAKVKGHILMASQTGFTIFDAKTLKVESSFQEKGSTLKAFKQSAACALVGLLETEAARPCPKRTRSPYERTRDAVYATGNKWQIEHFNATH